MLLRADEIVDRRHRHEDQADGEEHLVEMAPLVDMDIEGALEEEPDERAGDEDQRQGEEEIHAPAIDQEHADEAAGHGEGAMGEVDEIHDAERDGESDCKDEQDHPIGDAVEEDRQHGRRSHRVARMERSEIRGSPPCEPRIPLRSMRATGPRATAPP